MPTTSSSRRWQILSAPLTALLALLLALSLGSPAVAADDPPGPAGPPITPTLRLEEGDHLETVADESTALRLVAQTSGSEFHGGYTVSVATGAGQPRAVADGQVLPGEGGRAAIEVPPLGAGLHHVTVTTEATASFNAATVGIDLVASFVPTLVVDGDTEVAPGEPVSVSVTVTSGGTVDGGDVEVLDPEDRVVASARLSGGRATFSLGGMAQGSHYFTVRFAGTEQTRAAEEMFWVTARKWLPTTADRYFVPSGKARDVPAPGVLGNDGARAAEGHTLFVDVLVNPDFGSIHADGSLTLDARRSPSNPDLPLVGIYVVKELDENFHLVAISKQTKVTVSIGSPWLADTTLETKPFGKDWTEVDDDSPGASVVDGNPARLAYTLHNPTTSTTEVSVRAIDEKGASVSGAAEKVTVAPGENLERSTAIDTSGDAWVDGKPAGEATYTLEVTPAGSGTVTDGVDVKVDPLPVVLAHGYNTDAETWGGPAPASTRCCATRIHDCAATPSATDNSPASCAPDSSP